MGTFKDTTKTQAVRECIMKHIEDFNSYMEKCEAYDKNIQCVDGKERRVCPQSVMMLTELFHHFFDYCDEALFVEAVKKNLVAHLLHLMLAFPFNSYLHCHVLETLRRHRLEPKELRFVQKNSAAPPRLVLLTCRRDGGTGLTVHTPLLLQNDDGSDSDELRRIYFRDRG